ncbi:IclR family transcriptional regulator [Rathayibacter sp. VKM Ac-2630]|nr:IclR family transcriptional regulator [Rathayibacter sp. VKM Ac-2630]
MVSDRDEAGAAAVRAVKSSERTLRLLEVLAAHPGPLAITELHRLTGYPRSSLHQLLHTMAASDWIAMTADGAHAAIGSRALIVGTSYLDHDPALPWAVAALERVRTQVGYTAHYARLTGSDVLYLATREAQESRRRTSRVGRFLPAHATALGKALLSERTSVERAEALGQGELVALTPHTITDRAALETQLDEVHARRYAVEREENTPGVCCIGVPVRYRIPATDAISVSIPLDRAGDDEIAHVAETVRDIADELATTLQRSGVR